MIIAQITDLHVVARDRLCYRRVPTNAQLAEAVAHINNLKPSPDVVIASGDLTDHGRENEYEVLREILDQLQMPYFAIPGNHDNRELLLGILSEKVAPALAGDSSAPFVQYAIEDFPVRLVALDTTVPCQHHGELCDARLRWLDETLAARPDTPTLIFMHHPPFRTGVRWMDAIGLYGGRRMEAIVAQHRQVVRVVAGHIHRPIFVAWGGTIASTAPSTCHQVPLNFTDEHEFDFIIEPRAIQLHVMDPGYGMVSHLSYIPDGYQQFGMLAGVSEATRAELLSQNRRQYAELRRVEYDISQLPLAAPKPGRTG